VAAGHDGMRRRPAAASDVPRVRACRPAGGCSPPRHDEGMPFGGAGAGVPVNAVAGVFPLSSVVTWG
jgi:hypothetical protein